MSVVFLATAAGGQTASLALLTLLLTILFAVLYDMANGWNDAANAIATVISTRVLSPPRAIVFGAVLNFAGALFSAEVAKTVGHEIADARLLSGATFLAAVMTAPIWITFCSRRGLPNSCSHALMGALIGSAIATCGGFSALKADGIKKIFFGVLICPVAAFTLGHLLARLVTRISRNFRPGPAASVFGRLQLVSAGTMAFAHGTGDAQKAMGIITGALMAAFPTTFGARGFHIPFWVRILCATAMALGTSVGGWRVMRTLGSRLAHLRTYQGFSAETAASATILLNTLYGIPISTTHSITAAILGVGAARGAKAVRWGVGRKIVFAWVVTFPICIGAGALVFLLLKTVGIR
jgi:PiT family inorganic phosphate transporter